MLTTDVSADLVNPRAIERRALAAAYACAVIAALSLGYFIAGNPLQIDDSLSNMIQVQKASLWEMSVGQLRSDAYLRPMLWTQLDITFDLARGRYYEMYKAIHIAQVLLTGLLFVQLLRVRATSGLLAAMLGIAMLFGARTFSGTVYEGFPINTFLTTVLCCVVAAWLALRSRSWLNDVAVALLFVFAVLTFETGLLVWVILATAWLAGARGVSGRGVLATTALLVAYFIVRLGPLGVGTPDLLERSSGFGFRVLETDELTALFGDRAYLFYAYNIASQLLAVLIGEPKSGVWVFTRDLLEGSSLPYQYIAVVASTGATILIAWYIISRVREWRQAGLRFPHEWRSALSHADRLVLLFVAVLAANATISYPYTKDAIMSPAGVFHALAAAVAFGALVERLPRLAMSRVRAFAVVALLLTFNTAWAIRFVAIHYALREHAWIVRNDWTEVFGPHAPVDVGNDPQAVALTRQLQHEAIVRRVPASYFVQPRAFRYLEIPW
jgi:hypothetical protein